MQCPGLAARRAGPSSSLVAVLGFGGRPLIVGVAAGRRLAYHRLPLTEDLMATTVKDMMAEANAAVPRVSREEAQRLVDEGALVVDVRDPPEVAAGMVPGAINVSRGMLEFRADPASPSRDPAFDTARPVLLYCASGGRAALGGKVLKDLGYEHVYNLGGAKEWEAEGLTPAELLTPRRSD